MQASVRKVLKAAKADTNFRHIFLADDPGNKIPGPFTDQVTETMFVAIYLGYCMGKYGNASKHLGV